MVIDPDAPWVANLILILLITILPTIFAVRAKREAKRSVDTAKAAHVATTKQLGRVLHNVENQHVQGLRDDLDQKTSGIDEKLALVVNMIETIAADLRENSSDIRGTRTDLTRLRKDLVAVRADIRHDRGDFNELDRRVERAIHEAQAMLDRNHPGQVFWYSDDIKQAKTE